MQKNNAAQQLRTAMETDYLLDDAVQIVLAAAHENAGIMTVLSSQPDAGYGEKYRNVSSWIPKHLYLCHALELHRKQGLRILDLGCGPGWFSWLAGMLGHMPTGLDLPGRPAFYKDLCSAMALPVVEHRICPYTPLPESLRKYDVIVLLMAAFYFDSEQRWDDMDTWRFFLKDLDSRLAPGGTVLFEMNIKYGLCCSAELFDVFIEFGYRVAGKFCIKTGDANIYNAIERYDYKQNSFARIWYRASHVGYDTAVWPYIDLLVQLYPRAVDLSVQLAMSKILQGDGAAAVPLLEMAVRMRPRRLGYSILLAQVLFARGEREKALVIIQTARRAMPRSALPGAWEQMLRAADDTPAGQISPYWRWASELLAGSSVWQALLEERKDLAALADPVSWYLRYGVPLLPVARGFTPLIYWGINYDIFLGGQDPLLHYISYGKGEQRKI